MGLAILILDLVVVISFILTLLFAYLRGLPKTLHKTIVLLIPVVLLFIFLKPISHKIVETKIEVPGFIVDYIPEDIADTYLDEPQSIKSIITVVVANNVYKEDVSLQKDSELADLIGSFSESIVMLFVYIGGISVVFLLRWFLSLITLILRACFRIKLEKKSHLLGLATGVFQYAIVFVLIFLPIYGTLSLASTIIQDINTYQEKLNVDTEDFEPVLEISNEIENSFVKKLVFKPLTVVFCKDKDTTIDAQYVGNAISFETDNGVVKFYDEYRQIKLALNTGFKIVDVVEETKETGKEEISLSEFSNQEITSVSNLFRKSGLARTLLPVAVEVVAYNLKQENQEYSKMLEKMENINWNSELNTIADTIDILKNHRELVINIKNTESLLTSSGVINLTKDVVNKLHELELINEIVLPGAVLFLYDSLELQEIENEYNINFDLIKNIDWKIEGKTFTTSLINIYQIYIDTDIEFSSLTQALNNEKLPNAIDDVFDELNASAVINQKILPIAVQYFAANANKEEGLQIDIEGLKTVNWETNLPLIGDALKEIVEAYQVLEINPDDWKAVLKNPSLQGQLDEVVETILDVEVISQYLLPIVMNKVCDSLEENEGIKELEINFDNIRVANWKDEIGIIKDAFIEFLNAYQALEYDSENWTLILDDPNINQYAKNIINEAVKSPVLKDEVLPCFAVYINKLLSKSEELDVSFLNDIITKDNFVDLLTNDIDSLIDILKDLKKMGLLYDEVEPLDYSNPFIQDTLTHLVKTVFNLSVVEGKEAQVFDGLMEMANLKAQLTEYGVEFNYDNVTNWDQEIDNLCVMFTKMMTLTGNFNEFEFDNILDIVESEEEKEILGELIQSFSTSQIFGDSIYNVINKIVKNNYPDYDLIFTSEEKETIKNETTWKNEVINLLNILDKVQPIADTENYESLDAELIKEIMIEASNGVVSAKILGQELNILLDGVVDVDFTKRENLKNYADTVYDAIKLSQILDDSSLDLNDDTQVDTLISTIENLSKNEENVEIVNQFINQIVSPETEMNLTQEEISDASTIISSVVESYQNALDQDNFSYDDLSAEQKNDIENNEFAEEILKQIFGF